MNQIDNDSVLINRFKSLIMPKNNSYYEGDQGTFEEICLILKEKGYKVYVDKVVFYDFETIGLEYLAYNKIRSEIFKEQEDQSTVSWDARRNFINNKMEIVKGSKFKQPTINDEIIKKIEDINFIESNPSNYDNSLLQIANFIECILKVEKNKWLKLEEERTYENYLIMPDIVTDDMVYKYRKNLHIYRHNTREDIEKRAKVSEEEKKILISCGYFICTLIDEILKERLS